MPKIVSVGNKSGKGYRDSGGNIFQKLWSWFSSLDKFIKLAIVTMLIIIAVTPIINNQLFELRQHASPNKTATINIVPPTGSYPIGVPFTVDLVVDGGGATFNAAQAGVTVSSNLSITNISITPQSSGGCNFVFANNNATPKTSDPSFAGAILNSFSLKCTVYTLTLTPLSTGNGTVTITRGNIKDYQNNGEIFLSGQSGSFSLGTTITPSPTSVPLTPTTIPVLTYTPTPTPLGPTPTPTPTAQPLTPPTINAIPSQTYQTFLTISGTKSTSTSKVYINNSTTQVTYPTAITWQQAVQLSLGLNTFNVFGEDSIGNRSLATSVSVSLHKFGDISGDSVIDLTDLSMFATDWQNTGTLNYSLSDMNADSFVDLTDFSILAKAYGN